MTERRMTRPKSSLAMERRPTLRPPGGITTPQGATGYRVEHGDGGPRPTQPQLTLERRHRLVAARRSRTCARARG